MKKRKKKTAARKPIACFGPLENGYGCRLAGAIDCVSASVYSPFPTIVDTECYETQDWELDLAYLLACVGRAPLASIFPSTVRAKKIWIYFYRTPSRWSLPVSEDSISGVPLSDFGSGNTDVGLAEWLYETELVSNDEDEEPLYVECEYK